MYPCPDGACGSLIETIGTRLRPLLIQQACHDFGERSITFEDSENDFIVYISFDLQ